MSIAIRGVSKRFGAVTALDRIDLDIESGSLTALLGASGCGKSTLLRVIAGLEAPDEGLVHVAGAGARKLGSSGGNVGFVFQHFALFPHMTVAKNIAFGLEVRHTPRDVIDRRVLELLDLVKLTGYGNRHPRELSGGQRQRVALARALAPEPVTLLLDEPFGALDLHVRRSLRRWLRRLHEHTGLTTVLVTHDADEALEIADRIIVMDEGRVVASGTPGLIASQRDSAVVSRLLGHAPLEDEELAVEETLR
jgi:sulfate transport system ATP-binding protein